MCDSVTTLIERLGLKVRELENRIKTIEDGYADLKFKVSQLIDRVSELEKPDIWY